MAASSRGGADSSSHSQGELLDLLLEALSSSQLSTIPADTILGAITHYLSTIPDRDVARFTRVVVRSPTLWHGLIAPARVRDAISLAVEGKVGALRIRHQSAWLCGRRVSRDLRRWLSILATHLNEGDAAPRTHVQLGLLSGLAACEDMSFGVERVNLEEAVVLALAQHSAENSNLTSPPLQDDVDVLCQVIQLAAPERLGVLDLRAHFGNLQLRLFSALDDQKHTSEDVMTIAQALARLVKVMCASQADMSTSLTVRLLGGFVQAFKDRADRLERENITSRKGKLPAIKARFAESVAAAFLLPASSIVDVLLGGPLALASTDLESHSSFARLPILLLTTLASFSAALEQHDESVLEDFDHVQYGALDLVAGQDDLAVIQELFKELAKGDASSDSRSAFTLQCGELLVNRLDGPTLTSVLLPLCHRHLHDTTHQASYKAAHSFMLALIRSCTSSEGRAVRQKAFALEIVPYYSQLLLKHFKRGDMTVETFTESYIANIGLAGGLDPQMCADLISRLSPSPGDSETTCHILLAATTAASQHVSRRHLRAHLDHIGSRVVSLPAGENRLELTAKMFSMIRQDLDDNKKGIGMRWWLEWRDALLQRESGKPTRAKL